MRVLSACALLAFTSPASSIRDKTATIATDGIQSVTDAPSPPEAFDCGLLSDLKVGTHDLAQVGTMVCQNWPASFGRFPFSEVNQFSNFMSTIFDYGSVYDEFQKDIVSDKRNDMFCMRKERQREEKVSSQSACPEIVNNAIKEEFEASEDEEVRNFAVDGNWACVDEGSDMCGCIRRDNFSEVPSAHVKSRPQGCDMVHQDKCYGACPKGFAPTWLTGAFRPVCSSICGETNHPYGCGFGCANSRINCALIFVEQVKDVAAAVGRVISYVTVNIVPVVKRAVEGIANWALTTLPNVVKIAQSLWSNFTRAHQQAGLLAALMVVVREAQDQQGTLQPIFDDMLNSTSQFFLDLLDVEVGWDNLNLNWISNVLLKKGEQIVQESWGVLESFQFRECEVASDEVVFSVEDVGSDVMVGPWQRKGNKNGRPVYQLIGNGDTFLEWHNRENVWKMFLLDRTCCLGWWFAWLGLGWRELYRSTANSATFPTEGWRRIEGPNPLPTLVSAGA